MMYPPFYIVSIPSQALKCVVTMLQQMYLSLVSQVYTVVEMRRETKLQLEHPVDAYLLPSVVHQLRVARLLKSV